MLEELKKKLSEAKTQEEKEVIWASYTEEEKKAIRDEFEVTSANEEGELDDDALSMVAGGGFWPWTWF
ncbi:MAG: hypothetical protein Q4E51_09635 [Lachnospiraceae bacterium]|nr:hypothetical protein [Lachnospiraceae bacterium]MDO4966951.1 hypothetical protein [Lachnospiraceae bacterium]